jgi:hypothetical protein
MGDHEEGTTTPKNSGGGGDEMAGSKAQPNHDGGYLWAMLRYVLFIY